MMFQLENMVRKNILVLKPYITARDEFKGKEGVFLDANENPFGNFNRYPDPHQKKLKTEISVLKNIPPENIFIGNGSDEIIDLALRIFCNPESDKAVICPPTYGMYEILANINNVPIVSIPLLNDFQPNIETILKNDAKIIFLCSPNNPTGNQLNNLEIILQNFKGIVFIDEAYIDFSQHDSFLNNLNKYPNLIVSQTLSKAWGLAATRIGIAYSSKEIISFFTKVKYPYNISLPNQIAAITALQNKSKFLENLALILSEKKLLEKEFKKIKVIKKIYPSDANFFLVEVANANAIYERLLTKMIITRNRSTVVQNCIRITVGTPEENQLLIKELNLL